MRICLCDDDKILCDNLKEMILQHGAHAVTIFHSAEELFSYPRSKITYSKGTK